MPRRDAICSTCSKPFTTTYRTGVCEPCKYQASGKDLCACGAQKQRKSAACQRCATATPLSFPDLGPEDTAWVAGLMEGEGTFVCRPDAPGGRARVQMTDQDVIDRLQEVLKVGRITSYIPRNPNHKPSWIFVIQRKEHLCDLLVRIAPLMSVRRRAAISRILQHIGVPTDLPPAQTLQSLPDAASAAWLAGLIEGEGYIGPRQLSVRSVDEDTLRRALSITGAGAIRAEGRQRPHHHDVSKWFVTQPEDRLRIAEAVSPWLLSRRTDMLSQVAWK